MELSTSSSPTAPQRESRADGRPSGVEKSKPAEGITAGGYDRSSLCSLDCFLDDYKGANVAGRWLMAGPIRWVAESPWKKKAGEQASPASRHAPTRSLMQHMRYLRSAPFGRLCSQLADPGLCLGGNRRILRIRC